MKLIFLKSTIFVNIALPERGVECSIYSGKVYPIEGSSQISKNLLLCTSIYCSFIVQVSTCTCKILATIRSSEQCWRGLVYCVTKLSCSGKLVLLLYSLVHFDKENRFQENVVKK